MSALSEGDALSARFVVGAVVFEGPVATLYRGQDRRTGAEVAVKVLRPDVDGDVGRFERECAVLAELRHPGVVRYVAHGVSTNGARYLVTEWLDGEDLGCRLDRGALSVQESVALALALADAVAAMHARGIVHRDIKPANVFLVGREVSNARLLDLGLARRTRVTRSTTRGGSMLGTPGYMAPEQVRGERDLDARADVFALGALLFECVAGVGAIRGDSVEALLGNTLLEDVVRLSELCPATPPPLDELVAQMLSRDPARRPRDGSAVSAALGRMFVAPPLDATSAFDELPTDPRTERRASAAITRGERRLLSVVMLSTRTTGGDFDANLAILSRAAVASGADFEVLMDGVALAVLRGQGAATDQAAQAARCALALRHFAPTVPIAMATGWGEVAGRSAVGEVIDRAARLLRDVSARMANAPTAEIALGDVAAGLLDARFDVRDGRAGLTLAGERAADGPRTLLGRETPFVGREAELGALLGALDVCVRRSESAAVLLVAAPGLGKTRLRVEFERVARERFPSLASWVTRADPVRAGVPFAPIVPLLRELFGISPRDELALRRERVERRVGWHVPASERRRVAEFLGELIGTPFSDTSSEALRAARQDPLLLADQVDRAWHSLLAAECSARPVLLVLEDVQWADLATLRLIDHALGALPSMPLLVVLTGRPECIDPLTEWWPDRAPTQLRVEALDRRACEAVVAVLAPLADEELKARIVNTSGGNPYFLEELARGAARGRGVALPGSVLAMLQARLETLSAEQRQVLRAASIFGEAFWTEGVCALVRGGGASDWVHAALDALLRRGLIAAAPTSRLPSSSELVFASAQLRDAVYATLTEADRTLGHRLAAPWLEDAGVRDAVELADHYERGGLLPRAVPWYLAAAEDALGGNDFGLALARVERGIACGAEGDTLGRLHVIAAELHRWRGEHREALHAASRALDALPPGAPQWFAALGESAMAAARCGDATTLRSLMDRLGRAPCGDAAAPAKADASARAAIECVAAGEVSIARALVEAIPDALDGGDLRVSARALQARAMLAEFDGDVVTHEWLLDEAARRFEAAGDLRSMCVLRVGVGAARIVAGRFDKAEGALREARAAAVRLGLSQVVAQAECGLARAAIATGHYDDARELGRLALKSLRLQADQVLTAQAHAVQARAALGAGRLDEARDHALQAVEAAGAVAPVRALALATLSAVRAARGEAGDSLAAARSAMGALRTLDGVTEDEGFILLAYAEALALVDRWEDARRAITSAWDRLQRRASRFADEGSRVRFLQRIPEHARTEALFLRWAADA